MIKRYTKIGVVILVGLFDTSNKNITFTTP